ncbi:MAG TPA: hypothetical protein VNM92_04410 [Thermoanaerobaculia bacterium]|nr:hypothetical protein [Thermoanaerobaculia bacterium]
MTGKRLALGITIMGVAVPVVLFLLLGLKSFNQLATLSLVCMSGWAVAHLAGDILSLRRLGGRNNPVEALKQWEPGDSTPDGGSLEDRGQDRPA